jgi:hypothetical protein
MCVSGRVHETETESSVNASNDREWKPKRVNLELERL